MLQGGMHSIATANEEVAKLGGYISSSRNANHFLLEPNVDRCSSSK